MRKGEKSMAIRRACSPGGVSSSAARAENRDGLNPKGAAEISRGPRAHPQPRDMNASTENGEDSSPGEALPERYFIPSTLCFILASCI